MALDPIPLAVPHLLEVSHVAHRLSTSQDYVWALIKSGQLPAIRLGRRLRIDPVDLQAFIDKQRVTRTEPPSDRQRLRDVTRSAS